MFSASISVDTNGHYHISIVRGAPRPANNAKLIDVLYGNDEEELKSRAIKYVNGL
jgi:hypothetical protein